MLDARHFSRLISFVALLVIGSQAGASDVSDAKKKATAKLKEGMADAVASFKAATKARRLTLDVALDLVDAKIDNGVAALGTVYDVGTALNAFQIDMRSDIIQAEFSFRLARNAALDILDAAGLTAIEDRPAGFCCGDGGTIDATQAAFLKAIDDNYKSAVKRVLKTGARFEKELDVGLTVRLSAPAQFAEGAKYSYYDTESLTIDTLVAASVRGVANDGLVLLYGNGYLGDGSLHLGVATLNGSHSIFNATSADSSNRWQYVEMDQAEEDRSYRVMHTTKVAGLARASITIP